MPVGLEIINQDSIYQISENFFNYLFITKGTNTIPDRSSQLILTFNDSDNSTLLAIELTSTAVQVACSRVHDPNSKTTKYFLTTTTTAVGVTYYLFGSPAITSSSNYGLSVYNSSGGLIYNSSNAPLRIVGSFSDEAVVPDMTTSSTIQNTLYLPSGPRYAIIAAMATSASLAYYNGSIGQQFFFFSAHFYSYDPSTQYIVKHVRKGTGTSNGGGGSTTLLGAASANTVLVANVSNL